MLAGVTVWTDNEAHNALWHLLVEVDVDEVLANRDKQLVQLARYAHAGQPGECMGWGDVEISEFKAKYRALSEVLAEEGPSGAFEQ
jgi:hypothetical protein